MANALTGFWQTLVSAATEASQVLAPNWRAVESVYVDYDDKPGAMGQSINVYIPGNLNTSVTDQGTGNATLVDLGGTTVPIVYNRHPSVNFVVRDFEQYNSSARIRTIFLDDAIKAVKSYVNATITALFTSGNFNVNPVVSTTNHIITVPQFLSAFAVLSDQNVPVTDPDNMTLLLPSTPYAAMLDGTTGSGGAAWNQAFIVGNRIAETVRDSGRMPSNLGMTAKLDQQMPTSGSVGSRTFTGAYFHRWAIGLVSRPMPQPDGNVVEYTYVKFGDISLRIMVGYNQFPYQGYIVTVDAGYGLKVVRPEMGELFSIAE